MFSSILKGAQDNSLGLHQLSAEMEKSMTNLENIQRLLKGRTTHTTIKQERWQILERESQHKSLVLKKKEKEIKEKDELLIQARKQVTELEQALDLLQMKYRDESSRRQEEESNHQDKVHELEALIKKNHQLEDRVYQLNQAYEQKSKEKEIEFQRNLKCVQQQKLDECALLENIIDELENENQQYQTRLTKLNALYNESNENQPSRRIRTKSRIPVLSSRSKQQQVDIKREMNLMKDDLLLFQDNLVEKISQNKQLESAIERMNEHCQILRNSLNETREESADRYRKMMKYMQENSSLKEQLDHS